VSRQKKEEKYHPKGRRFPSKNNFASKQKGINTALTFAPLCVKTKWKEESYVVWLFSQMLQLEKE